MKNYLFTMCVLALGITHAACSVHARDPETYRKVTRNVVASQEGVLRQCYAAELESSPDAAGKVVVQFKVEKDTGRIVDPTLDEASTTAPVTLGSCVTAALEGLQIEPPDARDGLATFAWDFRPHD